ncbi:MAG: hypothetical protein AABX03_00440 [Nanoarchaeota archaeon]
MDYKKKGDSSLGVSEIVVLIIVLIIVVLFVGFFFYGNYITEWFRSLPGFNLNQDDTDKDISNLELPNSIVDSSCGAIVGGIVNYKNDVNRGSKFIGKYNNLCVAFTQEYCEFLGIYLNGEKEIKVYNKEINFDEPIGSLEGDSVNINSNVFDLSSEFNQRIRIFSFAKSSDGFNIDHFRDSLLYLDDSELSNIDLWLCKKKDWFKDRAKEENGESKFKPSWPESQGIDVISLNDFNAVKDGDHLIIDLSSYFTSDGSKILLYGLGNIYKNKDSFWNFGGILNEEIGLITPDGVVWVKGDYLDKNSQVLSDNNIIVNKDFGIFRLPGKGYNIKQGFDKKDYYESNLHINSGYYDKLLSQFEK